MAAKQSQYSFHDSYSSRMSYRRVALVGAPEWFHGCLEYDKSKIEVVCLDSLGEDLRKLDRRQIGQLEYAIDCNLLVVFPSPAAYFGGGRLRNEEGERKTGQPSRREKPESAESDADSVVGKGRDAKGEGDGREAGGFSEPECLRRILSRSINPGFSAASENGHDRWMEIMKWQMEFGYPRRMVFFEPYPPHAYPEHAAKALAACFGFGSDRNVLSSAPLSPVDFSMRSFVRRFLAAGTDEETISRFPGCRRGEKMSKKFFAAVQHVYDSSSTSENNLVYPFEVQKAVRHGRDDAEDDFYVRYLERDISSLEIGYMKSFWEDVLNREACKVEPSSNFWGEMHKWYKVEAKRDMMPTYLTLGHFLTSASMMLHAALLPWPASSEDMCKMLRPILGVYDIELAPSDKHEIMKKRVEIASRKLDKPIYLGNSRLLYGYYKSVLQAAIDSRAHVLIVGESGTGKEHTAELIHELSDRRSKTFHAINCASLTTNIAYSELFGYAKGAFTGAEEDRTGAIEKAEGGTLFLDEIHHLPMESIAHLLRFLQDRSVRRMGDGEDCRPETRIIAATNDLEFSGNQTLRSIGFLQRFKRRIHLLGLNERVEEMERLANHFLDRAMKETEKVGEDKVRRRRDLYEALHLRQWKYRDWTDLNIRELENEVERIVMDMEPDSWLEEPPARPEADSAEEGRSTPDGPAERGGRSRGPTPNIGDADMLEILREAEKELGKGDSGEVRVGKISQKAGGKYGTRPGLRNRLDRIKDEQVKKEAFEVYGRLFPDHRKSKRKGKK